MPHFGHVILLRIFEVKAEVLIGVRTISSRLGNGRRLPSCVVGADVHTDSDTDPGEPRNMQSLLAFEWIQAAPQSFCLNDVA